MTNLDHLSMFVEVADLGSFSACARNSGKVQSAISQGIASLEAEIGVDLFDRSTRKPKLTAAGERLLTYAQVILQQNNEFSTVAKSILKKEESKLTLAIDLNVYLPSISDILYAFSQKFPSTNLDVNAITSPDILDLIECGRADIGIMFSDMAFRESVDLSYIGSLPLVAVCGEDHPMAGMESVEIFQAKAYTQFMIRGEDGGGLDHQVELSNSNWGSNSIITIIDLISAGIGWGYIPEHLVEYQFASRRLQKIKMRLDQKAWKVPVDVATPKNKAKGPAFTWLNEQFVHMFPDS